MTDELIYDYNVALLLKTCKLLTTHRIICNDTNPCLFYVHKCILKCITASSFTNIFIALNQDKTILIFLREKLFYNLEYVIVALIRLLELKVLTNTFLIL